MRGAKIMNNNNSKKCYIVYELDAFINDVKYIKEYNTLKEIEEE